MWAKMSTKRLRCSIRNIFGWFIYIHILPFSTSLVIFVAFMIFEPSLEIKLMHLRLNSIFQNVTVQLIAQGLLMSLPILKLPV